MKSGPLETCTSLRLSFRSNTSLLASQPNIFTHRNDVMLAANVATTSLATPSPSISVSASRPSSLRAAGGAAMAANREVERVARTRVRDEIARETACQGFAWG